MKHEFTEQEVAYFLNIDFVEHVALVAVVEEDGRLVIVGARYIVLRSGKAEVAFAVIDQYQGQGIGAALLRHLVVIAKDAGLREFVADVLPGNDAMLSVFAKTGFPLRTEREPAVVRVWLRLDADYRRPLPPPAGP